MRGGRVGFDARRIQGFLEGCTENGELCGVDWIQHDCWLAVIHVWDFLILFIANKGISCIFGYYSVWGSEVVFSVFCVHS
jgi:hypothetical protein